MSTETRKRANTLTVRLTDEELTMLDRTCEYVRRTGRTVLGEPTITHADALKRLAALGYRKVDTALRREVAATDAQTQPPAGDSSRTPDAPGAASTLPHNSGPATGSHT